MAFVAHSLQSSPQITRIVSLLRRIVDITEQTNSPRPKFNDRLRHHNYVMDLEAKGNLDPERGQISLNSIYSGLLHVIGAAL
jgi:hypothetical protein